MLLRPHPHLTRVDRFGAINPAALAARGLVLLWTPSHGQFEPVVLRGGGLGNSLESSFTAPTITRTPLGLAAAFGANNAGRTYLGTGISWAQSIGTD